MKALKTKVTNIIFMLCIVVIYTVVTWIDPEFGAHE